MVKVRNYKEVMNLAVTRAWFLIFFIAFIAGYKLQLTNLFNTESL